MPFIVASLFIALFCVWGLVRSLREKNLLGIAFAGGSALLFGWFAIMSLASEFGIIS